MSMGDRLERARHRRFVGRADELARFEALLPPDGAGGVLFVHGPGGTGKSALLGRMAERATAAGRLPVLVDGHEVEPSPAGFTAAVAAALGEEAGGDLEPEHLGGRVLVVDTFEWLAPIEDWFRQQLLPTLPSDTVVVVAGRRPPQPGWLADGGWRDLLHVLALRNLRPVDVEAYAGIEGLPPELTDEVVALTHGHPLAMSLLVDALRRSGDRGQVPRSWTEAPDLVTALLGRLVDDVPSERELGALHVCARARTTTEAVLRAALPDADAPALFAWLRAQTFVTTGADGLRPHDIAREVIDADLRWRDPGTYRDVYRRVRRHQVDRIRHHAAGRADRQRAVADTVYLVRQHPVAGGVYWDLDALGNGFVEPLRTDDVTALLDLTRRRQGEEQASLAARWMARQPAAFSVFRRRGGELLGYAAYLSLATADPDDVAADPGTAAMWAHTQRHGPPRAGELVKAWRFLVGASEGGERDDHAAGTLLGLVHVSDLLVRPATAWDYIGVYTDVAHWEPFLAHYDFRRVADADYGIGGRTYAVFGHDWRRVGVDDWLELTSAHDLGAPVDPHAGAGRELAVLSEEGFATAVKDALRDLHDPPALARNPLLRSALVDRVVRAETGPDRPEDALRQLVVAAAAALAGNERTEELERVLDRTFLHPAPSQEKAAEVLDLSFSTYRRRRDQAIAAVVQRLWAREVDGPAG